jgi:type II secretory pathway component PulM
VSIARQAAAAFPGLHNRWSGLSLRDRRIVTVVAAIAAAALAWSAVWQPLQRDVGAMRAAAPREAAALRDGRRVADEVAGLARAAAPAPAVDARAALDRTLAEHRLRAAVTQLDWQEGRARIVFAAVGFDALVAVLEALQCDGHLRVVEAAITARVEPGSVRAEITLAR